MKDVVIIGGGAVGLWCAWHLQQAGRDVTILDKGHFDDGCSYGNAGMIVPSHFTPLASPGMISKGLQWMFKKESPFYIKPRLNLELTHWLWKFYKSATKKHVIACAPLLKDMHEESRELYKHLDGSEGFDFGFEQKGILMLYTSLNAYKEELEAAEAAHALGMEAKQLEQSQLQSLDPLISSHVAGGIHYPGDATIAPQLFMRQMKLKLEHNGVSFQSGSEVINVEGSSDPVTIKLMNGQSLHCKKLVVATGSWSGKLMKSTGIRMLMQDGKGYSMDIEGLDQSPAIPSILHEARVAVTPMSGKLRISGTLEISGMDERIQTPKVNGILKAMPEYYNGLSVVRPERVWYGYRPCTPDGMPYIGPLNGHASIIAATGHAMMGLSLAPATGRMVKDLVLQQQGVTPLMDPCRFAD